MKRRRKKQVKRESSQIRSLFDHLKIITEKHDVTWDSMSESDKKTFSPYMVNRFLSMNSEWLQLVSQLQRLTIGVLDKREVFRLYYEFIPSGRIFLKYVKAKSPITIPDAMADILVTAYECSRREAIDYYKILKSSTGGKLELVDLMKNYGLQDDEIKKLKKEMKI